MGKRRRILNSSSLFPNKKNKATKEDQIEQLPDDILGVIISQLSLKEAGRTSILSRRWKNLWTLTTCLNFDATKQFRSRRGKYIKWVNQVLKNYRASDLDEFTLMVDLKPENYHCLNEWIRFAVRKRVKAININLCPDILYGRFKECRFMTGISGLSGIECLKSLCLKSVNITGKNIEWLLFSCPLLEKLCLERSKSCLHNLKVVGSSLKLKCLQLVCCCLNSIEICAPNLVSFHYDGGKIGWKVQDLFCLVNLSVENCWSNMDCLFVSFSEYFFQLKTLTLNCSSYKKFLVFVGVGQTQLTNLNHLTLDLRWNRQYTLQILSQFINKCPLLHKLTLKLQKWNYNKQGEMKKGNRCPHQCLKVVEIIGFDGHGDHVEVAMFILDNAIWLKKFIINLRVQMQMNESRRQVEELKTKIPRGVELLINEDVKN